MKNNLFTALLFFIFLFITGCHNQSDYVAGNSQYARKAKVDTAISGAIKTKDINSYNKPSMLDNAYNPAGQQRGRRDNDTSNYTATDNADHLHDREGTHEANTEMSGKGKSGHAASDSKVKK